MRPGLLHSAGVATAALVAFACACARPDPRNVLLITLDTTRADRLGCYGSTLGLTPALDALAEESALFKRAYTTAPLTTPSHAAMLTGRYPLTFGLRNNGGQVMSQDEVLLSETLRERGFRTAAIVSALPLASVFGLNQGWDLYYEDGIVPSRAGKGLWYNHRPGNLSVDRAITWLKGQSDRPFFLWVHLFDPHSDYDPPSPYKERYSAQPYDGEIAFTDSQVGRLLAAMKELGVYDDTLIVAVADHGEGLGDHGERTHGIFIYETTMHVPLIVKIPSGRGRVVTDLASTIDIAPTVLEALGLERPPAMQGVSLLPSVARGERVPARPLYLESIYATSSYGWATPRALVWSSWKLIDLPDPELYDLAADPKEALTRHGADPSRAQEMEAQLTSLTAELERSSRPTVGAQLDEETLQALQSLGYVAGQQDLPTLETGPDPKRVAYVHLPLTIAGNLLDKGKAADAEEVYVKALEHDPTNKQALTRLGKALADQRKIDQAVEIYEKVLSLYPSVEDIYRDYAGALIAARRLVDARAVLERATKSLPESAILHQRLGHVRFLQGDCGGAEPELDLATRLAPLNGRPWYLIAVCRTRAGDEPGAMAALENYLKRNPDLDSVMTDPFFDPLRRLPAFEQTIRRYL